MPTKPAVTTVGDSTAMTEVDISYTVKFDVNSVVIRTFHKKELGKIVAGLKSQGDRHILLSVYSDKSGNASYNKKLTQQRLLAVKKELTALGIKKENILENNFGSELSQEELSIDERKVVVQVLYK